MPNALIIVLVEKPQHHREDLKHVERVEHLEKQQREHTAQRYEDLVAAVDQPPDALLVHGQALGVVDQHARHLHVQALQLHELFRLIAPDVAQLLAAEVAHRARVLEPAAGAMIVLALVRLVYQHLFRPIERTLPVRGKQQPVLPPVHHQPQNAERQQKPDVAQERFAQAALVPGDEHLVLLAIVQDVVHGRLKAGGLVTFVAAGVGCTIGFVHNHKVVGGGSSSSRIAGKRRVQLGGCQPPILPPSPPTSTDRQWPTLPPSPARQYRSRTSSHEATTVPSTPAMQAASKEEFCTFALLLLALLL
uniref:Uncharacterized protein n=1 Tax=Anopheles coluzzii TaxID=1518534 RepID=A0A8W7PVV2_ANOCL